MKSTAKKDNRPYWAKNLERMRQARGEPDNVRFTDDASELEEPVSVPKKTVGLKILHRVARKSPPNHYKVMSFSKSAPSDWKPGMEMQRIPFAQLPHQLFFSQTFKRLRMPSKLLLVAFLVQFNGKNNGKLTAALAWLRTCCGWGNSPRTLARSLEELQAAKLIRLTRDWTEWRCAYYELTWIRNSDD